MRSPQHQPSPGLEQLLEAYAVQGDVDRFPEEYVKFGLDDPAFIHALQTDLQAMAPVRAMACYESVIETMTDHLGVPPTFTSSRTDRPLELLDSTRPEPLTIFAVGHSLDYRHIPVHRRYEPEQFNHVVLDADVVGVIEDIRPGESGDPSITVDESLLDSDYVTFCRVFGDRIYSVVPSDTVTPESFATHVKGNLRQRGLLLTNHSSKYESIYPPTLEFLLNEHLHRFQEDRH